MTANFNIVVNYYGNNVNLYLDDIETYALQEKAVNYNILRDRRENNAI